MGSGGGAMAFGVQLPEIGAGFIGVFVTAFILFEIIDKPLV
jgi:hypothetical protein